MKEKVLMIIIGGVLAWAGTSLLKINALEVSVDNHQQSIQELILLHLK